MTINGAIVPSIDIIGLSFCIFGLALVMPVAFAFKQYLRFLDYIQFMYLWGSTIMLAATFSNYLDKSWLIFMPSFLTFCSAGDLVCTAGGQLSFTICLIGAVSILAIIVSI